MRDNKYIFGVSRLSGCGTERPSSRSFVTFLGVIVFGLFAFAFTFTFDRVLRGTRELIVHQLALPLLSDHFDAVSRSDFLPLREPVERTGCQQAKSWDIDDALCLGL